MIRKSLTEYALLASGQSQTWMASAEAALVEHQGYVVQEAADPVLVDAVLDVKRASASYKATDEERLLGLQASCITLNPHPLGGKGQARCSHWA